MDGSDAAPPAWAKAMINNVASLSTMIKANSDVIKKSTEDMTASVDLLGKRLDALEEKTKGGFFPLNS